MCMRVCLCARVCVIACVWSFWNFHKRHNYACSHAHTRFDTCASVPGVWTPGHERERDCGTHWSAYNWQSIQGFALISWRGVASNWQTCMQEHTQLCCSLFCFLFFPLFSFLLQERSGETDYGYGSEKATSYTVPSHVARGDGKRGIGMPGGQAWTKRWLHFDNSFFKEQFKSDKQLLWLPTDHALTQAEYKQHFAEFARDNNAFLRAYAAAHRKLSESGSAFAFHITLQ